MIVKNWQKWIQRIVLKHSTFWNSLIMNRRKLWRVSANSCLRKEFRKGKELAFRNSWINDPKRATFSNHQGGGNKQIASSFEKSFVWGLSDLTKDMRVSQQNSSNSISGLTTVFFLLTKIKNHNNIIIDSSEKSLIKDWDQWVFFKF